MGSLMKDMKSVTRAGSSLSENDVRDIPKM